MSCKKRRVSSKKSRKSTSGFLKLVLLAVAVVLLIRITDNLITKKNYPLKYYEYIKTYSKMYDVPQHVICAVIDTESGFDSNAVSSKGAIGLMQITPDTFRWLCEYTNIGGEYDVSALYDPQINIKYGTFFMSYLYEKFGVWETAHAAYNAGLNRVNGWLKDSDISKDGILYNIPIKETRQYVEKIKKAKQVYFETYFKNNKGVE